MTRGLSVVAVAAMLMACGGKAESGADEPGTGGSPAAGGSSATGGAAGAGGGTSAGGSASTGGAAGAAGAGGAECVQEGDGWSDETSPTCEDLVVLAVDTPVVQSDSGDPLVSAGEAFELQVVLREVAGEGFSMYPGVKFESDHPGVTIQENDWFYGIFACSSYDVLATGKVDPGVKPGTVITLTARAAMLNTDCPSAPELTVKLTVQ